MCQDAKIVTDTWSYVASEKAKQNAQNNKSKKNVSKSYFDSRWSTFGKTRKVSFRKFVEVNCTFKSCKNALRTSVAAHHFPSTSVAHLLSRAMRGSDNVLRSTGRIKSHGDLRLRCSCGSSHGPRRRGDRGRWSRWENCGELETGLGLMWSTQSTQWGVIPRVSF